MSGITVAPLKGFRRFVAFANVLHDLDAKISDRSKNASGDEVSLNLGKPQLELIEPGRVSRRVVNVDIRMGRQECSNAFSFMGRQIK